jgi:hypothetical protein
MVDTAIKIHDKFSFEIKWTYKLGAAKKSNIYAIDTYLFIPGSLDINKSTYKKETFYNDLKIYIRFKTPVYLLREISHGGKSPLNKLKKSFKKMVSKNEVKSILNYEYNIKMFCCIFKSSIRDHISHIRKNGIKTENLYLISNYIENVKKMLLSFRELREIIDVPKIREEIFLIYMFADEYLSNISETYTTNLIELIENQKTKNFDKIKNKLLTLSLAEVKYRKDNKYKTIPQKEGTNEELLYRRSVLRKYMENKLFLDIHSVRHGKIMEQLLFGIAAGIAMVFTTIIAFTAQSTFGNLTLPFFIILVVSYMFKDRIKELLRFYFSGRIKKLFFDHKVKIYDDKKKILGHCKESFAFLKEKYISLGVLKIRNRKHITEIENGWMKEKIILYRKRVKIFAKSFQKIYPDYKIDSVNDITRFSITHFLNKMDNPQTRILLSTGNKLQELSGDRVYHLNMVINYNKDNYSFLKRFRIVLNKDGIKRIEKVSSEID